MEPPTAPRSQSPSTRPAAARARDESDDNHRGSLARAPTATRQPQHSSARSRTARQSKAKRVARRWRWRQRQERAGPASDSATHVPRAPTATYGYAPTPRPGSHGRAREMFKALFSWQNFGFLATVALSFLFDKHCPITE